MLPVAGLSETLAGAPLCEEKLSSPDYQLRLEAVECVGEAATIERLALRDPHWLVRRAAVGRLADTKVLAEVAKTDPDSGVRARAVAGLTDPESLLGIALQDEVRAVRLAAAEHLVDPSRRLELFQSSGDVAVRSLVATQLPAEAVPLILADAAAQVRITAVDRVDGTVLAELATADQDPGIRVRAVERLGDKALIERIARQDTAPAVRLAAVAKTDAIEILLAIASNDPDERVRIRAVERFPDPNAARPLLGDHRGELRLAAARRLGDDTVLWTLARDDPEPAVRRGAVESLPVQDQLSEVAIFERDASVAVAAVIRIQSQTALSRVVWEALCAAPREEATGRLSDAALLAEVALKHPLAQLRLRAVRALKDGAVLARVAIGDVDRFVRREAVLSIENPALLEDVVTRDPSREVRQAALGRLRAEAHLLAVATGNGHAGERIAAAGRLQEVTSVLRVLDTVSDRQIRTAAIGTLSLDGARRLAETSSDSWVRRVAVQAIHEPSVLEKITTGASDLDVRTVAAGRVTPLFARELVETAVDESVRAAAVLVLDDQEVLSRLALSDRSPRVRLAALGRVHRVESLLQATTDSAPVFRATAVGVLPEDRKGGFLADDSSLVRRAALNAGLAADRVTAVALGDIDARVRVDALRFVADPDVIERAARRDPEPIVRRAAVERCSKRELLLEVASRDASAAVRLAAIRRLHTPSDLAGPARHDDEWYLRQVAVKRTSSAELLSERAMRDPHEAVRRSAALRLLDLGLPPPKAEQPSPNSAGEGSILRRGLQELTEAPEFREVTGLTLDLRVSGEATSYADRSSTVPPSEVSRGTRIMERVSIRILDGDGSVLVDREYVGLRSGKVALLGKGAAERVVTVYFPADVDLVVVATDLLAALRPSLGTAPEGPSALATARRLWIDQETRGS